MRIKPYLWEIDTNQTFCCYDFKASAFDDLGNRNIATNGKEILFIGVPIHFCPYCGAKITLEKDVEQPLNITK